MRDQRYPRTTWVLIWAFNFVSDSTWEPNCLGLRDVRAESARAWAASPTVKYRTVFTCTIIEQWKSINVYDLSIHRTRSVTSRWFHIAVVHNADENVCCAARNNNKLIRRKRYAVAYNIIMGVGVDLVPRRVKLHRQTTPRAVHSRRNCASKTPNKVKYTYGGGEGKYD